MGRDIAHRGRRIGAALLLVFLVALVASLFVASDRALASAAQSPAIVADGSNYFRVASVGTTGTATTFPKGGAGSMYVENEDATNVLYIKLIRATDPVENAELTAPANATWSEVQPIPADDFFVFDVRRSPGFIYDRAAGSGAMTVRIID